MKTRVITVTQKDIDAVPNSNIGRSKTCPVARAMCRQAKKGIGYFSVGTDEVLIGKNYEKCVALPQQAREFIEAFDGRRNDVSIKPFTFTLEY